MYTIRIGNIFGTGITSWQALVNACNGDKGKASKIADKIELSTCASVDDGVKEWEVYAKNGERIGRQQKY
jgi:hypothetical protein